MTDDYYQLTTLAQEKGDSAAEAIAMEIGAYMGEVTLQWIRKHIF